VGLVHMNGRVYDPELGRFLSADPFVQDASNAQSWNRYAYVLNNPLSMTDPTGFFFGSIFHAIGNFVGGLFKAVASVFKAALRIPLIRAVIQIAACGSGVIALCVGGGTGALAAAAGGGIEDVLKAMAFTVASYGVWGGVGGVLHGIESSFTTASVLVSSAVHGVVNGALSLAQGGSFIDGFVSGAIGQAAGMFAMNGPLGAIGGNGGSTIRSIFAGAAGGAASELTGGKFMNGFVTAAFAQMWNGEGGFLACAGAAATATAACAGAVASVGACPETGASCVAAVPLTDACMVAGAAMTAACGVANSQTRVNANSSTSKLGTEVYYLINRSSGEIDKIGITSFPNTRHRQSYLNAENVDYVSQTQYSSRYPALVDENIRLTWYLIQNRRLPRLNKTTR
jgi:hypothetical protein